MATALHLLETHADEAPHEYRGWAMQTVEHLKHVDN